MTTSTVNFSIPEDLKREFNKAFPGENKSAVIARLMRHAIEERQRQRRRAAAIDALLQLRRSQRPVAGREVSVARRKGRP
jgi:metal-responsive CopG/Arc/MetJ family transcriptional regulator